MEISLEKESKLDSIKKNGVNPFPQRPIATLHQLSPYWVDTKPYQKVERVIWEFLHASFDQRYALSIVGDKGAGKTELLNKLMDTFGGSKGKVPSCLFIPLQLIGKNPGEMIINSFSEFFCEAKVYSKRLERNCYILDYIRHELVWEMLEKVHSNEGSETWRPYVKNLFQKYITYTSEDLKNKREIPYEELDKMYNLDLLFRNEGRETIFSKANQGYFSREKHLWSKEHENFFCKLISLEGPIFPEIEKNLFAKYFKNFRKF